ncbi:MAG: cyclic pyranopterin monophosphate synthase MoaC [Chloroflexi bacterium]|nr:cyclic pyranopterin monophosphate synthase MoaC [Chloroflexota bacterium]
MSSRQPPSPPDPEPSESNPSALTHLDVQGTARMVDVGHKADTERVAVAGGRVLVNAETFAAIRDGLVKKGDVLTVARIAGIMAAKRTSELIPLCHPLPLTHIDLDLELDASISAVNIRATARTTGKTGVEMEALTAVSVAALTIYDMAKALDRKMQIEGIHLLEKRGGKSGDYRAKDF